MDTLVFEFRLAPGEPHAMPLSAAWNAVVLEGVVWATVPGGEDALLACGAQLSRAEGLVFEAVGKPARLRVEAHASLAASTRGGVARTARGGPAALRPLRNLGYSVLKWMGTEPRAPRAPR